MARGKQNSEPEEDDLERAPWEDGAMAVVDVTSVPVEVVHKNCLSNDLTLRLTYIKGLASAATRANKRELTKLLEVLGPLLEDEAVGVRLETLQQLQQLAKLAHATVAPDDVCEAVEDALEAQIRPSLDPGGGGGGGRSGAAGTGALPMVREELLATLDAACAALGPPRAAPLLMRLHRAASAAVEKAGGVGAPGAGGGGGKAGGDAMLMALSLAAVAVRHLPAERGGLEVAALAGRMGRHGDLRVREAVAGVLPRLYERYAASPGALDDLFSAYEPLCSDSVWSVKQAAARAVGELAQLCGGSAAAGGGTTAAPAAAEQRADSFQSRLLVQLLLGCLLPSKSQWVVTAARQQLGPAIAALRPGPAALAECLPPLLEAFCAAAAAVGQGAVEVKRAAAESFADVAVKAGAQHWPQLQPAFARLLASSDGPTLCSLLAAASEAAAEAAVAVVSGPLLEVLRSRLHLVAPAASGALAGLLEVCPAELQREMLQVLPTLSAPPAAGTGRCGDWRPRLSLAASLHAVVRAVAPAAGPDAAAEVARCALALCADPVWAVRRAAAEQVGRILADAVPPADAAGALRIAQAQEISASSSHGPVLQDAAAAGQLPRSTGPADTRHDMARGDDGTDSSCSTRREPEEGAAPAGLQRRQTGDGGPAGEGDPGGRTQRSGGSGESAANAAAGARAPEEAPLLSAASAASESLAGYGGDAVLGITGSQWSWVLRALGVAGAEPVGGGGGGSGDGREAAAAQGSEGGEQAGDSLAALAVIGPWLRSVSGQHSRADKMLLAACCRGAFAQARKGGADAV
ncbi:hypothetical protein GPECTOR_13g738 [Gonium pectorale]|uniref:TOG domain-containing protein n=1 Tax=Gonium pectorale TaxID=33097 RepID=A0A150GN82_GONPE|nr:hypothetical protein GPECTOR_13g738 [Gonium pectorale]|eukprot:KXZ51251.1 hypothetical protein GPECTOR_13g738 [Gonium pectorale]